LAVHADATLIDFESFADGDLVSGPGIFGGVAFSATGDTIKVTSVGDASKVARHSNEALTPSYTATFLTSGVKFVAVSFSNDSPLESSLWLNAYDSSNHLVASAAGYIEGSPFCDFTLLLSSSSDISYVTFGSCGPSAGGLYWDNFEYHKYTVPEVGRSVMFLGLSMLPLAWFNQRRSWTGK